MSWTKPMAAIAARLGPPPRVVSSEEAAAWTLPRWIDGLHQGYDALYDEQRRVVATGRLALGRVWRADGAAYQPVGSNDTGDLLYTFDETLIAAPELLDPIANDLFTLQDAANPTANRDPALRHLQGKLWNNRTPHYGVPVPARLTRGPLVYMSSVLLVRRQLPYGALAQRCLPVLVGADGHALVVPWPFWPRATMEAWR